MCLALRFDLAGGYGGWLQVSLPEKWVVASPQGQHAHRECGRCVIFPTPLLIVSPLEFQGVERQTGECGMIMIEAWERFKAV